MCISCTHTFLISGSGWKYVEKSWQCCLLKISSRLSLGLAEQVRLFLKYKWHRSAWCLGIKPEDQRILILQTPPKKLIDIWLSYTANEGPVRILNKCLVPIYVSTNITVKPPYFQNRTIYNVLSPNSYTHISVRDLYISRIGLSILMQPNM
jgi:hypothetical protein